MKHVVLSTDMAGQPKVDDVDSLDEAIALVERLRNDDAVEDVRVLREVPIEVRTYYKVVALEGEESAGAQGGQSPVTPSEPPVPAGDAAPSASSEPPAPSEPEPVEQPVATDDAPRPEPRGDEGFFTPPPVRSHPLEDEAEPAPDASPSERRTSLFGRG